MIRAQNVGSEHRPCLNPLVGKLVAPVVLTGVSSHDQEDVAAHIKNILIDEVDDLYLTRNFTGDLVFEARFRYAGGALKTVDHSLTKRRRRTYTES